VRAEQGDGADAWKTARLIAMAFGFTGVFG
jgi:hypothetical protein